MDTVNSENFPAWIKRPQDLKNVTELSYADTSQVDQMVDVVDVSLIKKAVKQFNYWRKDLSSQTSDKTIIFCLLGKAGITKPNILEVCVHLNKLCDMSKMIETFSAANSNFMGISFSNTEEVAKIKLNFNYFQDSMVLPIIPPSPDIIDFRLLWLPPLFQTEHVRGLLSKFSSSFKFDNETMKTGPDRYTRTNVVRGSLTLKKGTSIDNIPHFVRLPAPHRGFALVVIPSRPPLCLRCRETGHIRNLCSAVKCSNCNSFHLQDTTCGLVSYAHKLKGYDKDTPSQAWWDDASDVNPISSIESTTTLTVRSNSVISNVTTSLGAHSLKDSLPLGQIFRSAVINYQPHTTPIENKLCTSSPMVDYSRTCLKDKSLNKETVPLIPGIAHHSSSPSFGPSPKESLPLVMEHSQLIVRESSPANLDSGFSSKKKIKMAHDNTTIATLVTPSQLPSSSTPHTIDCSLDNSMSQDDHHLPSSDYDSMDDGENEHKDEALLLKLGCNLEDLQKLRLVTPCLSLTPVIIKKISFLKEQGFSLSDIINKSAILRFSLKSLVERSKLLNTHYVTSHTITDICKPGNFFESLRQGRQVKRN